MNTRDGRSTRWEPHRQLRRAQLVDAALAAIRRHGPLVGMDEVAAEAATSKTALYRHFAGQAQLYLAVSTRVADTLLAQLRAVLVPDAEPRETLAAAIDVYLQLIEADPHVYRFVVHRRPVDTDPVDGLIDLIGDHVAEMIADRLRRGGRDPAPAPAWGHGLVGLVRAAADPWLDGRTTLTRAQLSGHLTDLSWAGLAGLLALDREEP